MGLFDKKRKPAIAAEQQSVEAEVTDAQAAESQADAQPEADAPSAAGLSVPAQSAADRPQPASEPQAPAPAAEPQAPASAADSQPAAAPQPAGEWSAPAEPAKSAESATDQIMSAPSLENVIVTKSRDLSRLSREDLLQLLLAQSKDAERLQDYLRDVADEFERCTSLNERLREKLDAKDEQIERLKGRLDDKDKRIARMQARLNELEVSKEEEERRARIIVNAAEGMRGALEAFNATADWYVASLQDVCGDIDRRSAAAFAPHAPAGRWPAPAATTAPAVTPAPMAAPAAATTPVPAAPAPEAPGAGDNQKAADA